MNSMRRSVKEYIVLISLYLIGNLLNILPFSRNTFLLRNISSFYFLSLGIAVFIYFSNKVIDRVLRRYLSFIGAMIVLWFFFRLEKYAAFSESTFIMRHLWYAYYIPYLLIPQFSLLAALSVGNPSKKLPVIRRITCAVTVTLIAVIMTNDLHGLVFGFNDNFVNSLTDYSYRPLYFISIVWIVLLAIAMVCVLLQKCSLPFIKRKAWILPVYLFPFAVWGVLIALDIRPKVFGQNFGEFPENACFAMGGIWVLCICIGLIPSNTGYGDLFSRTHLSVWITDAKYRVRYRSNTAPRLPSESLPEKSPFMADENHIVFRRKIAGGYVFRNVDISEINRINRNLEETAEVLCGEEELIRSDNEMKARQALAEEKSRLYDNIAVRVLGQSKIIEKLTAEINGNSPDFAEKMGKISVFGVYIKRMSNLMLFSADNERLSIKELHLAVGESLRYIKKTGIPSEMLADSSVFEIPSSDLISAYELFESFYEKALPDLTAITAVFDKNLLKLTFEGVSFEEENGSFCTVTNDEGTSFVRIIIGKESEEI